MFKIDTINRVIDGDTVELTILVEEYNSTFDLTLGVKLPIVVRLFGIDAPEIKNYSDNHPLEKILGLQLKKYVKFLLSEPRDYMFDYKGKKDSFGRYLGDIVIDGISLTNFLLNKGIVAHYGEKYKWGEADKHKFIDLS